MLSEPSQRKGSESDKVTYRAVAGVSGFKNTNSHRRAWWQVKVSGWGFGVKVCAATTGVVLIVNTTLTILTAVKYDSSGGLHIIQQGHCGRAQRTNLLLHLLINIIGTVLLSASNYCMQGLSSPTRQEVNTAHHNLKWLDIGIPSVRNLRSIDCHRLYLWLLIGVSSLPLHLMFNSAVFSSLSANEYSVLVVTKDFSANANWTLRDGQGGDVERERVRKIQREYTTYERLDMASCVREYQKQFLSTRQDVVVVSTLNSTDGNSMLRYQYSIPDWDPFKPEPSFTWMCDVDKINYHHYCDPSRTLAIEGTWNLTGKIRVDYCISNTTTEQCRLYFSSTIMIIVILCNFIKFLCMWIAGTKYATSGLMTIGDAAASFISDPDPMTANMCLATQNDFRKGWIQSTPRIWQPKSYFWFQAISKRRWMFFIASTSAALASCASLLSLAIKKLDGSNVPTDLRSLWKMGLGTINVYTLIWPEDDYGYKPYTVKTVIGAIMLVNTPQVLLSFLYFMLNGALTCMLTAQEWSHFATKRKSLRVTAPVGVQRSTYFLQLPYRYAIPLIVFSTLIHFLNSQSFFLAKIVVYEDGKENSLNSSTLFGFSAIGIVFIIITAMVLLMGVLCLAFRRHSSDMPFVLSCSAAISAACHTSPGETDVVSQSMRWGVVYEGEEQRPGHCAFSSEDVRPPVAARHYT